MSVNVLGNSGRLAGFEPASQPLKVGSGDGGGLSFHHVGCCALSGAYIEN